jgi:hypothetical protein
LPAGSDFPKYPGDHNFKISFGPWMKKQHHKHHQLNKVKVKPHPPSQKLSNSSSIKSTPTTKQIKILPIIPNNLSKVSKNSSSQLFVIVGRPTRATISPKQLHSDSSKNNSHHHPHRHYIYAQQKGEVTIPQPTTAKQDSSIIDANNNTRKKWDFSRGEFVNNTNGKNVVDYHTHQHTTNSRNNDIHIESSSTSSALFQNRSSRSSDNFQSIHHDKQLIMIKSKRRKRRHHRFL